MRTFAWVVQTLETPGTDLYSLYVALLCSLTLTPTMFYILNLYLASLHIHTHQVRQIQHSVNREILKTDISMLYNSLTTIVYQKHPVGQSSQHLLFIRSSNDTAMASTLMSKSGTFELMW